MENDRSVKFEVVHALTSGKKGALEVALACLHGMSEEQVRDMVTSTRLFLDDEDLEEV